ncbi:unnamed protein product [Musa acuminata subsp. burmannicoides]
MAASTSQIGQIDEDRKSITEFETTNDSEVRRQRPAYPLLCSCTNREILSSSSVRPAVSLTMRMPIMANPTRKGQLRLHPPLRNTGHGSSFLISPRACPLTTLCLSRFLGTPLLLMQS